MVTCRENRHDFADFLKIAIYSPISEKSAKSWRFSRHGVKSVNEKKSWINRYVDKKKMRTSSVAWVKLKDFFGSDIVRPGLKEV